MEWLVSELWTGGKFFIILNIEFLKTTPDYYRVEHKKWDIELIYELP